jgi:hypothetical protein
VKFVKCNTVFPTQLKIIPSKEVCLATAKIIKERNPM